MSLTTLKDERENLAKLKAELETKLQAAEKRLTKLLSVQSLDEPEVGTVLRFSRKVAGSSFKYTFVAVKVSKAQKSWYLTGRKNALNVLGLTDQGNTWDDLLVAIADAKVQLATSWAPPGEPTYRVFADKPGYGDRQWEVNVDTKEVRFRVDSNRSWTEWKYGVMSNLADLERAVEGGHLVEVNA